MVLVANPNLVAQHGLPQSLADLDHFPLVAQGHAENIRPWIFHEPDEREVTYVPRPRFISDNLLAIRAVALAGIGATQMPLEACSEALRAGSLHELLPNYAPAASTVYAIYPSRRGLTSAGRTLISFLEEKFQAVG